MRILLVNPKYPQTFWSFNRVLRMLNKKVLLPPLGLLTVAALLPQTWQYRLADLVARDISEEDWNQCDVVLVTGLVNQYSGILETVRRAKARGKTVVVGGPMAFHIPEDILAAGADVVVKGEAEPAVDELVKCLERGDSGVIIEAPQLADMADSPPPRYDLMNLDDYVDMGLQFSRGCPFRCEFCDITLMHGRRVRTKSTKQILNELQVLYDLGWRKAVFFVDDNLIGNVSRAKALLRELIPWMEERRHPFDFYTQASVNLAADRELLDMMVRAGFYRVFLGIETPDKESLELTKKYQNVAADLNQVCERINRAGMQIIAGIIIGFDNERPDVDQRLIQFASRNQIPEMFITLLQAGPGTDLFKRLEQEGRLLSPVSVDDFGSQTGMINFVTTRPIDGIVKEFVQAYDVLFEPGFYLDRLGEHFARMNRPPINKAPVPLSLSELRAVLITIIRQGLMYPSRWKWWKALFKVLRRSPNTFPHFMASCVTAEHYFQFRQTIKKQLPEALAQREQHWVLSTACGAPVQSGQKSSQTP
ncbi:B12-binding domain-containing radical SAM protein [Thermodesulfobacteriota bacterium]